MEYPPHVIIVGAGALGSFVGGLLSTVTRVSLIGREHHLRAIKEKGLHISGITDRTFHPRAAIIPEDIPPEKGKVFVFTVKGYNTELAVETIHQFVHEGDVFLTLQNGVGNDDIIREHLGEEGILAGVTSHGITFVEPGHIIHAGKGETVIGALRREDDDIAQKLTGLFNRAGIETRVTRNICGEVWAKLIVNAAINPITAITGLRNGEVLEFPELLETVGWVVEEVENTARANEIILPPCDMLEKTLGVLKNTTGNKSSMLQDIERGRRTEIDSINGAVVRYAEGTDVGVLLNRSLTALVKAVEGKEK
ncbi:MAG: 2-dehydropantoate 2-reductase [Thermoplasmata archaeon]|nr:2-dehydropantoate 2-reductase [Thermoplasmata archaeon]